MGCGCGGRRNASARSSRVATTPPSQALQAGVNARQVQIQSNQKQVLIQRAKEQLQQQNQNVPSALNDPQKEVERKKRIQVSLRNRYGKIR
jgi:hypothetical protein